MSLNTWKSTSLNEHSAVENSGEVVATIDAGTCNVLACDCAVRDVAVLDKVHVEEFIR